MLPTYKALSCKSLTHKALSYKSIREGFNKTNIESVEHVINAFSKNAFFFNIITIFSRKKKEKNVQFSYKQNVDRRGKD